MKWNAEALDRFLEEKTAGRKLPGVAVCIRGPEGVLFSRGYGHRDGAGLLPVDGDTIFGVASMSKSMTALALAMLEEEGKLSLEDPVVRYFPAFRVPGNARDEVTLRHLATHTSGIPPMEPLEWSIAKNTPGRGSSWARTLQASAPNAMSTIQEVIDYIAQGRYPTLGAPGEIMSYSNEGYAILSYVVDQAAGIPLEQFLQERVFRPLGMERSVMDVAGEKARVLANGNISALFDLDDEGAALLGRSLVHPAPLPGKRLCPLHRPRYGPVLPVSLQRRRAGRGPAPPRPGGGEAGRTGLPHPGEGLLLPGPQQAPSGRACVL